MKSLIRIIVFTLSFVPFFTIAQDSFSIKGQLSSIDNKKVYLVYYNADNQEVRDSSLIKNGNFIFNGSIETPLQATLILDHNGDGLEKMRRLRRVDYKRFYLDNESILITTTDSIKYSEIAGSKLNFDYFTYSEFINKASTKTIASIDSSYATANEFQKRDTAFINALRSKYNAAMVERKTRQEQFIHDHPDSYVSLIALQDISSQTRDLSPQKPLFDHLSPDLKNSPLGKIISNAMELSAKGTVGAMATDFTQTDVNGKTVKLSDFKGKFVLIDFWASWCVPCRRENPNVVKAYNAYKNKNFTILGVSLDKLAQKDAWLKAINNDGLTWTEVSDLQGWKNEAALQYGVTSIPANFLIDPQGKIIARDLRGDDLNKTLETFLNK